ncbi:hypothetical protein L1987_14977 [Smallanthus sonchifolius]|uniref:Uncharacterized protein n=1 Tax=Smallanthus sonchifolius TaxID=185202 RepID=A0ACB9J534_9ASTR|nr:hypothetical protein L1987_14977 [Smallanthus sonchifolius]
MTFPSYPLVVVGGVEAGNSVDSLLGMGVVADGVEVVFVSSSCLEDAPNLDCLGVVRIVLSSLQLLVFVPYPLATWDIYPWGVQTVDTPHKLEPLRRLRHLSNASPMVLALHKSTEGVGARICHVMISLRSIEAFTSGKYLSRNNFARSFQVVTDLGDSNVVRLHSGTHNMKLLKELMRVFVLLASKGG